MDLTPGQAHESTRCEPRVRRLLEERPDVLPQWLAEDKAYSAGRIRAWLTDQWIEPVIAKRKDERAPGDDKEFDHATYRRRGVIECRIGWLKERRALATRFEKLAVNLLRTIRLAMILRYMRLLDSSDRA